MAGVKVLVTYAVMVCTVQAMIMPVPTPPRPTITQKPSVSLNHPLDLTFVMDTTGSMTSYINSVKENIRQIVDEIVASSKSDVRLALIEYRDHRPQDSTFVTRTHDFTESVSTMKSWLRKTQASGGGDSPEAVADALYEATKLSWRAESTKVSVLISDAPPHALDPSRDSSFHNGCPDGHDPMESVRDLARIGVTLYSVGCEPSITKYKDFFEALAFLTGGQYVPMSDPRRLIDVIIGGAQEELSLKQFSSEVQQEVEKVVAVGGTVDEQEIALSVYNRLNSKGAKTKHLLKNNKALAGPSDSAKLLADSTSMADVRKKLKFDDKPRNHFSRGHFSRRVHRRRKMKVRDPLRSSGLKRKHRRKYKKSRKLSSAGSKFAVHRRIRPSSAIFEDSMVAESLPVGLYGTSSSSKSRSKETYSTVESGITLGQIARLVKKETSKLEVS